MDEDFLLAIRLQEQFDNEYETSSYSSSSFEGNGFGQSSKKRKVEVAGGGSGVVPYWKPTVRPDRPLSIVDASWETLDPSPDVRAMFLEFNETFFWGKLCGVEVKWSPRMTLCAGVCSYEGRGGLCSIRLSEPLLKLRPRKDLVETLLHEMIHALLFVTQNNRDRDGHGPEFCKHMNRINSASGTKISIYHSFHDEVDVYRQHWWKCNGPCQHRKPYLGFVKRAMNRAPSAQDPWWEDHKRTCGGTYTKVKEPEGYGKKGKKDAKKDGKTSEKKDSGKKDSGNGKSSSYSTGSGSQDIRDIIPFSGKGFLLGGVTQSSGSPPPSHTPEVPSSLRKLFTPSSPAKTLSSPVGPVLDNKGLSSTSPCVRPAPSVGQKQPVKRSVSNTRAFVNINGSPVRIPKPHSSSSRSQDGDGATQKSIEDLFNSFSRAAGRSATSDPETQRDSRTSPASATSASPLTAASSPRTSLPSPSESRRSGVSSGTRGSPANPTLSEYFSGSNRARTSGAAGGGQVSRKRPWDDSRSSSSITDFFQKTSGSDPAASRGAGETKSPAMQRRTATATASSSSSLQSSAGLNSLTPSSSSLSSSSALMVSCPACQAEVQESKINEHLDSCLS
ncbi:sprT-like domain-containing protein Spartan [Etheostoma cragini]|uniref:sprT-like domain-containing protein Spartan n=1 Tax=Etheostoma cragini TaxID=417921 RepID=UPI00155E8061|nr:sprT-like domain-containing protein Spartan [Etheostoma cragini]